MLNLSDHKDVLTIDIRTLHTSRNRARLPAGGALGCWYTGTYLLCLTAAITNKTGRQTLCHISTVLSNTLSSTIYTTSICEDK